MFLTLLTSWEGEDLIRFGWFRPFGLLSPAIPTGCSLAQVAFDEGFNERTGKPKAIHVTGGTGPPGTLGLWPWSSQLTNIIFLYKSYHKYS